MFLTKKNIILASGSPRRQTYLKDMGITFAVVTADIDESPVVGEKPRSYVCRMAREKGLEVMRNNPKSWVIAADTIVSIDDEILGKPKGFNDAVHTLMLLNGREHEVTTSFCLGLRQKNILHEEHIVSKVKFVSFTRKTAEAYVRTGESQDKAGGYGIQGRGAFLVSGVKGSYSNIVGLPLSELLTALQKYQIVEVS